MSDYLQARLTMVDSQLRPNRILEPSLIEACQSVPREWFVSARLQAAAYADEDLPLGHGRFILAPLTTVRLLQAAGIAKTDAVLVVAGGTGYAACLAAKLARTVTLVEPDSALAAQARGAARRANIQNISVIEGPAEQGYAARGPYDVVILEGAVSQVPVALARQLAPGGRLLTILLTEGEAPLVAPDIAPMGHAVLMRHIGGALTSSILFETGTPALPGLNRLPAFAL